MRTKDIHITFGLWSKETLTASKVLHPDETVILNLDDPLNIGPLCDLYTPERIHARKEWLGKIFAEVSMVDKDLETIQSFTDNLQHIRKIYLWMGLHTFETAEVLNAMRLLCHLSELDKEIFMLDFPNIPLERADGKGMMYPGSLAVVAIEQVKILSGSFIPVDKNEVKRFPQRWSGLLSGNSNLRVLEKDGCVREKDDCFYDASLLKNCTEIFQPTARVIGRTLCDIDFSVGDGFLNWRLKQLISDGALEGRGMIREIREYEVKKTESIQKEE